MTDKAWKATERRIAAALGGHRVPVTGRARGATPDIAHSWLCPEVKHRAALPGWLKEAMEQARAAAAPGQLAVAVLHEHGQAGAGDLVVMRLADFTAWFGDFEPHVGDHGAA